MAEETPAVHPRFGEPRGCSEPLVSCSVQDRTHFTIPFL